MRWDGRLVRLFNERMEPIAVQVRHEPGRFRTQPDPLADGNISGIERGTAWLLGTVRRLGPHGSRWAEAVIQERGLEGVRVLQGVLALAGRPPVADREGAWDIALSHAAYHLRTLRVLLRGHDAARQEQLPFRQEHPLLRDLSVSGPFVQNAFTKETSSGRTR